MSKAKVIHKDGLFVRKDKSRSSEWVRIIPCGEEFEFYEEYNGWLKVADGWVVCSDVYIQPVEVTGGAELPFGEETSLVQVYPDDNFSGFVAGETYVVVYDGTTYECEAWVKNGNNNVSLGNAHHLNESDPDTGEPFLLGYNRDALTAISVDGFDFDKLTDIHHKNVTVTTIDPKFLPNIVIKHIGDSDSDLTFECNATFEDLRAQWVAGTLLPPYYYRCDSESISLIATAVTITAFEEGDSAYVPFGSDGDIHRFSLEFVSFDGIDITVIFMADGTITEKNPSGEVS